MGIFDRLFGRGKAAAADSERRIPPAPIVTAEQEQMNRDLMEAEMTASRQKRDDQQNV